MPYERDFLVLHWQYKHCLLNKVHSFKIQTHSNTQFWPRKTNILILKSMILKQKKIKHKTIYNTPNNTLYIMDFLLEVMERKKEKKIGAVGKQRKSHYTAFILGQ
uniref:Uncharacterized protein n=1 Tax=Cacopsylla melanoneura TaxID=428564 RepID=A0A8D9BI41_9HEMI